MRIHNHLPTLIECLSRWKKRPSVEEFTHAYHAPMAELVREAFGEGPEMYQLLEDVNWKEYRAEALRLDPVREEERVRRHLQDVERLFGFELQGEIVLFGAFTAMDGYARFDRGTHRVFLGVDESHGRGRYLDVLEVHELVHVARESRAEAWEGWGLDPKMTHDEFVEYQPTVEHLFGEGFSCTVSEILVPGEDPWHYAYQESREALERILQNAAAVDRTVHRELGLGPDEGDWSRLYSPGSYSPRLPVFSHYLWGWQWTKRLLKEKAQGDASRLVEICSEEFLEHAKSFELSKSKAELENRLKEIRG